MLAAVLDQSGVSPIFFHAGGFAERVIKDCDAILRRTGGRPQGREEHKTDDESGTSYRLHVLLLSLSQHTGRSQRDNAQPPLANGASGKRCDIDRKPERVSIGSMRIKARVAISCSILIMRNGGNKPARRRLQRFVRCLGWNKSRDATSGTEANDAN